MEPEFAGGAVLLVPLTHAQLSEANIELSDHHLVVLARDVENVRGALKAIKWKRRPTITAAEAYALHKQYRGETGRPVRCASPWLGSDSVDHDSEANFAGEGEGSVAY